MVFPKQQVQGRGPENERSGQVTRDFQMELQEARPKAQYIAGVLRELGILCKEIDVERAGMLAQVESLDGEYLGDLISLGDKCKEELLEDVRRSRSSAVARGALGIERGSHINHIASLIPFSTANWMAEIHFDSDESCYALVGEWIVPTADTPLGWVREYRLYQAKADSRCDVPGCEAT
ncbi:MAG TPA: hypothetical protein VKR06_07525 [Ktedonosporobacter sp.]|nr:hypothetical protein [Ktedonosporobacter sp.]